MSKLNRLIGLASKALDKSSGSGSSPTSSSSSQAGGTGDWRSMVRGAADALTGDSRSARPPQPATPGRRADPLAPPAWDASARGAASRGPAATPPQPASQADRAAIARYQYLLETADPHSVERVHEEAFARLTPAQRAQVHAEMQSGLAPHERPRTTEPADLARSATRAEMGNPGLMPRLLARINGAGVRGGRSGSGLDGARIAAGGLAAGGLAAGGLLAVVAGGAITSAVAAPLLENAANFGVDFESLAAGVDPEALAGGFEEFAGEGLAGIGEHVSGIGEQIPGLGLPGLGDLFGR